MEEADHLEEFWDGILSREETKIRESFASVTEAERADCVAHLYTMVSDPEYLDVQRESARIALAVLEA